MPMRTCTYRRDEQVECLSYEKPFCTDNHNPY